MNDTLPLPTETGPLASAAAADFESAASTRAQEPTWLRDRRETAWSHFCELGLPHAKQETWRFTNPRPIREISASAAAAPGAPPSEVPLGGSGIGCQASTQEPRAMLEPTTSWRPGFVNLHAKRTSTRAPRFCGLGKRTWARLVAARWG